MNNLRWVVPAMGALCLSHSAIAQTFTFREVKTSISQAYLPAPTAITDSGDVLINVNTNGGLAAYFLHNQKLISIAYQPYDTVNYANNHQTIVGVDLNGSSFVQNSAGKRSLLTGPNGDGLYATGINNKGVVAVQDTTNGSSYLYQNGVFSPFQVAKNPTTVMNVNDLGNVCGVYSDSQAAYAFATRLGKVMKIDVPTSTGNPGLPYAINNSGQVVGNTTIDSPSIAVGFVSSPHGKVTIINGSTFGPPAVPGAKGPLLMTANSATSTSVWGENNRGEIVGQAILFYSDGVHLRPLYYGFVGHPTSIVP